MKRYGGPTSKTLKDMFLSLNAVSYDNALGEWLRANQA